MKKLLLIMLIVVFALSCIFIGSGCKAESVDATAEETAETTAAENTAAAETTAAETTAADTAEKDIWGTEPIEITLWTWQTTPAYGEYYDWIAAEYNKLHPNITINHDFYEITAGGYVEALKAAVAGGEAPDLFGVHPDNLPEFADAGALVEITDLLLNDPEWSEWIKPSLGIKELYWKDKIYYVPQGVNHRGVYYWKDMWPNGIPQTLEELYTEADRLNAEGIIPYAAGGAEPLILLDLFVTFTHQLNQPDENMIPQADVAEISWVNDTFKTAIEKAYEMYEKGVFPEDLISLQYGQDAFESFQAKKSAAFWFGGPWYVSVLDKTELENDNIGWDFLPAINSNYEKQIIGGIAATEAVNADSEHLEIALDILKFTNSPEAQAVLFNNLGDIPPGGHLFAGQKSGVAMWDKMIEMQGSADIGYPYINTAATKQELYNQMALVILGETTVDDALAAVEAISQKENK